MTYFKPALFAAAFIFASAQAQTADSPAARKSAETLASHHLHPGLSYDRSYVYDYDLPGDTSVSFEVMQRREPTDKWFRGKQVHDLVPVLVSLELNEASIEPRIIDRMNAFFRNRLKGQRPALAPIRCSKAGMRSGSDGPWPCEEIRLKFRATFNDIETFKDPRTGEYGSAGACTIFVRVRERDASWWCHAVNPVKRSSDESDAADN